MNPLDSAVSSIKRGGFVVLHDGKGRENEADLVCFARSITPRMVRRMRKEAGGLICVAIDTESSQRLKIPFAYDMLRASKNPLLFKMGKKKMGYGDFPAFTISINHLSTFTGITDNDRAKTISEFGGLISGRGGPKEFRRGFRSIGHVFLLTGRGLQRRRGHTELSLELARRAKVAPAMALCEMLSDSGNAATREEAAAYARKNNFPFIEGRELVKGMQ